MACILIVDDEEGVQASLVKAFSLEGYEAVGAGSGTRVGVDGWQAAVRSRHPSRSSFFMGVF